MFKTSVLTTVAVILAASFSFAQSAMINEINYLASNPRQGVELAGAKAADLTGWSLTAYGADGLTAATYDLSGVLFPDQQNGHGSIWLEVSQSGNGGALALTDNAGSLVQFVAYGTVSSLTAKNGPANGAVAKYVGNQPDASTSLQLIGTGLAATDFIWWNVPVSPGSVNPQQYFAAPSIWGRSAAATPAAAVAIFPNPTAEMVTVSWEGNASPERQIRIFNANGQLVRSHRVTEAMATTLRVNDLPSGNYWLQVDAQPAHRLLVQH